MIFAPHPMCDGFLSLNGGQNSEAGYAQSDKLQAGTWKQVDVVVCDTVASG